MVAHRIGVFWFRRRPNFGDVLAPLLVERFAGMGAYWAPPPRSEAVVIGSVAGHVARGYRGVVLGVGRIEESIELDLSSAKVLGLRGELTRKDSGVTGDIVLGDSGLLAAELFGARPEPQHPLGTVAHINDASMPAHYPDALHVDVGADPSTVVRQIASCERIVASSLHGLITADALGIPRLWKLTPGARGNGFKFRDYSTALGVPIEPDKWITAPATQVDRIKRRLSDAFSQIPTAMPAMRRPEPGRLHRLVDNVAWRIARRA